MPEDLRVAHARTDEVVERIYIGRRFQGDTERLEKNCSTCTSRQRRRLPLERAEISKRKDIKTPLCNG